MLRHLRRTQEVDLDEAAFMGANNSALKAKIRQQPMEAVAAPPPSMIPGRWNELVTVDPPSKRSAHIAATDSQFMYIFGGYHDGQCFADLHRFHLATKRWQKLNTTGTIPAQTASHSGVLDGTNLFVFGGSGVPFGLSNSNDFYVCDLTTLVWTRLPANGQCPSPRYGQSLVCTKQGEVYLFGGTSGLTFFNDLYKYDFKKLEWTQIQAANPPSPRYRHEAFVYGDGMYIVGGGAPNPTEHQPIEVFKYTFATQRWERIPTKGAMSRITKNSMPVARRSHSCVVHENAAYIYGGTDGINMLGDIWKLDLETFTWHGFQIESRPSPKYFHSAAITPAGCMYIFGGCLDTKGERRSNDVQSLWVTVPSLLELCTSKILEMHTGPNRRRTTSAHSNHTRAGRMGHTEDVIMGGAGLSRCGSVYDDMDLPEDLKLIMPHKFEVAA
eukprot:Colp12_sorted_trinity150504_noHs@27347